MSQYRFSLRASKSLDAIMEWTVDRFGESKAEDYEDALLKRCQALAAGEPPHGRPCSVLAGGETNTDHLLYVRVASHYLIFRQENDGIVVLDVVHKRRDIAEMIKRIAKKNSQ